MWVWSLLSGTKSGMSRTTEASRPLTSLPWTCFSSLKTYSGLSSDHNLPTMYWVQLGTTVFSIPSLQREALHHISDVLFFFFCHSLTSSLLITMVFPLSPGQHHGLTSFLHIDPFLPHLSVHHCPYIVLILSLYYFLTVVLYFSFLPSPIHSIIQSLYILFWITHFIRAETMSTFFFHCLNHPKNMIMISIQQYWITDLTATLCLRLFSAVITKYYRLDSS